MFCMAAGLCVIATACPDQNTPTDGNLGGVVARLTSSVSASVATSTSLSRDGNSVAIVSTDSTIVGIDGNGGYPDVFLRDLAAGSWSRVSGGNGASFGPSVSAIGDVVAFTSKSTNLAGSDVNGDVEDVFVWQRSTAVVTRLSNGNGPSGQAIVDGDGGLVAFESSATNLTPGIDNNGSMSDVFVWTRATGQIERVTNGDGESHVGAFAGDGSVVYLSSAATDLTGVPDLDGHVDVYARTLATHVTSRVTNGDGDSWPMSTNATGLQVVVSSEATDLGPADKNGSIADLFVFNGPTGPFTLVATGDAPVMSASVSDDGRYVAFVTAASNIVANDSNGLDDVFVRDRSVAKTTRIDGSDATVGLPSISADGGEVAFGSRAPNLAPPDSNDDPLSSTGDEGDVFTWTRSS